MRKLLNEYGIAFILGLFVVSVGLGDIQSEVWRALKTMHRVWSGETSLGVFQCKLEEKHCDGQTARGDLCKALVVLSDSTRSLEFRANAVSNLTQKWMSSESSMELREESASEIASYVDAIGGKPIVLVGDVSAQLTVPYDQLVIRTPEEYSWSIIKASGGISFLMAAMVSVGMSIRRSRVIRTPRDRGRRQRG